MSDRALRARSRSRGPSGRSSPQMYDTYAEESFQDGYRAGYQRGCYMDGESRGFLDGYNARRMKKAQGYGSDEDSVEEENDSTDEDDEDNDKDSRKHEIMDKIWNLAEPGSELEKLVLEYDDASGNTDDEETDTDTEETDSDDEDDDTGKNDNQNNKSNEQN